MKKAIAIIVLGLLLSGKAYAACSVASGDISGTSAGSPHTTAYTCENNNTFILDVNEYASGSAKRIGVSTATNVIINIAGNLLATGSGQVIDSGDSGTAALTIQSTLVDGELIFGLIQGDANGIFIKAGDNWTVDNYGTIYGKAAKAIKIQGGDDNKITNQSGAFIKTDGANGILITGEDSDDGENTIIENYGTISADRSTVKAGNLSSGTTITNYSGGIIKATKTNLSHAAVQIDGDNTTITNKGTISGAGTTHSIEVKNGVTGTKIYVDGAPTFTGEVDLNNAAANTTMYLGCSMTQDTTIEIHNHGGALNVENNLCGNDTYTLSTEVLDGSDSDDGYLIIDEGLEVVSNNASYRSENVLTKLKGLFSAANYIDGVEPEDKFFRVFYSNVKRENMYKGSMAGVVGQLSPINWGNVTSNVFLGYSKHYGDMMHYYLRLQDLHRLLDIH